MEGGWSLDQRRLKGEQAQGSPGHLGAGLAGLVGLGEAGGTAFLTSPC